MAAITRIFHVADPETEQERNPLHDACLRGRHCVPLSLPLSPSVCVRCGAWKSEMQDDSWLHMGRGSIRMPATIATNSRCLIECAEWVSWEQGAHEAGRDAVALGEGRGRYMAKCQGIMHEYQLSNAKLNESSSTLFQLKQWQIERKPDCMEGKLVRFTTPSSLSASPRFRPSEVCSVN